jgi:predicted Rossmann fold nucleotide-binding protein DprA/Smf involved in DNA uptake
VLTPIQIARVEPSYPPALTRFLGDHAPERISTLGDLAILQQKTIALFCSRKCPGGLILQTYDLAQYLRDAGVTVIGGFHSPMERECLTILLRGTQPLIVCPARGIEGMQNRPKFKRPLADGRLLLLSPFAKTVRRGDKRTALDRNRFVAALADRMFVAYADPLGKTAAFCRELLAWSKPLYTLASPANAELIALGAKPLEPGQSHELCSDVAGA